MSLSSDLLKREDVTPSGGERANNEFRRENLRSFVLQKDVLHEKLDVERKTFKILIILKHNSVSKIQCK